MTGSVASLRPYVRAGIALLLLVNLSPALAPRSVQAQTTLVVDADGRATATDCNANQRTFSRIQDAVNAAPPGSTILICPGTYAEQVVVTKSNLTLRGVDPGLTVLRPSDLPVDPGQPGTGAARKAILLVNGATGVSVARLTIDGSAADGGVAAILDCGMVGFVVGVYYRNSSGTVDSTHVTNLRSATRCSAGIYGDSGGGASANLVVNGNLVDNYGNVGVVCNGQNTACTVTGNTLRGRGPVNDQVQFGLAIRLGGTAAITGNVIRDHYYTPAMGIASGMYLFLADPDTNPHLLQTNTFIGNELAIQRFGTETTAFGP